MMEYLMKFGGEINIDIFRERDWVCNADLALACSIQSALEAYVAQLWTHFQNFNRLRA